MAEIFGGLLFSGYSLAGRLIQPLMPLVLERRARRGLEERTRRSERYGYGAVPRPDKPVVWVHAASVGETNAVLPLVGRLTEAGFCVVLTTITVTGAATAARNPPDGTLHQFSPVDIKPYVSRFLDHWRPQLALFVESEVWPVITDQLARRAIPHVIVNAHMSAKSFRRWRLLGTAPRRVFSRITLALAQSEMDAKRLRRLGVGDARTVGNLKFDVPAPEADPTVLAALRDELANRPVFLAASTHPGEEEIVAEAHRLLARRFPALVTVIVPRHPQRGPAIAEAFAEHGAGAPLRSDGGRFPDGGGILIADTLGELGLFYRLTDIAFVGGTLTPVGGHNPVEPVALEAAVLHGPLTGNFATIFAALDAACAAVAVTTASELAAEVGRLLDDPAARRKQVEKATRAMAEFTGALDRTLEALAPYIDGKAPR